MKIETEINYLGVLLTIEADYQPEEPEVKYYSDGTGYPGCSAEFEIHRILTESGDDILGIFYESQLEDIEQLCFINLEK